jgi:nucleoside phosphorylase
MALHQYDVQDYTVGWVCALPIEHTAATVMLDVQHQSPPHDDNDPTLYTLGRIGNHNVVLACLPAGQIGTNSAAVVATRMQSKFPSLRIGLMVGIGGGVPSAGADIRLGDVVISQPYATHGGVVQYDFGKTGGGGRLTPIGFLNMPPTVLLNAISKQRSNHYIDQNALSMHLSNFKRLPQFSHDGAGEDVLYEASYNHIGGPTCDRCRKDKTVERTPRSCQEMVIHYGTIASGNQVMKDGITRDRLSVELGGVLCFEMEAAGLMNSFPCLVIRGICDYADSHKNERWQPYAAAAAAACAKEVLLLVPASQISMAMAGGNGSVDVLEWLSPTPYDNRHNEIKRCWIDGTGMWLLDTLQYKLWRFKSDAPSFLWCYGGPGTGKTVLTYCRFPSIITAASTTNSTQVLDNRRAAERCWRRYRRGLRVSRLRRQPSTNNGKHYRKSRKAALIV